MGPVSQICSNSVWASNSSVTANYSGVGEMACRLTILYILMFAAKVMSITEVADRTRHEMMLVSILDLILLVTIWHQERFGKRVQAKKKEKPPPFMFL